jgi:Malectin domain
LQFFHELGDPILSAVEIIPGTPGKQLPIRLVSQEKSVTDHEGRVWGPDNFYAGGQFIVRKDTITGTPDPSLYAAERFGNFNYAIPVDTRDTYDVTAHFAEGYWGSPLDRTGSGSGSRIFDIDCNGQRLLNNLDIYKEVGGMRALTKTFRGLRPNAQGKLILSFAPIVNYASVSAIEVEDEGR